ncbi:MAG: hypothetical protein WAO35_20045 [Terriglobia bacterium]
MSNRLDSKPQIWTLAADLDLSVSGSPSRSILDFATGRAKRIARKFRCTSLNELLAATAGEVETTFEEVHSHSDLQHVRSNYVNKGENAFANLEEELRGPEDYAITIRRVQREEWEPQFVSVIDFRGDKVFRSYFSKWHELAHLLTLTPQMRLVFRRTHCGSTARDPEEMLMDAIAGEVGFLQDFLPVGNSTDVSFEGIRRIREECCPDASEEAATIGIVKALPIPCILLKAKLALRKHESVRALQMGLGIGEPMPTPVLRAINVTVNNAARNEGVHFHKNWRVPSKSVISRVYANGDYSESAEDLSWWVTSDRSSLDPCPVLVKAKKSWDSVQALVVPQI